MRYFLSAPARAGHVCCTTTLALLFALMQFSSSYAQAGPAGKNASPTRVHHSEQVRLPRWLADAVIRAAQATNTKPAVLTALADRDPALLPNRRVTASSAQGVFQFGEGTWLEVLRRYGSKHGYGAQAKAIRIVRGRPVVANSTERERLLSLRRDPYLSALMAGELITTHRQILAGKVARDPSFAELYMAHFLGVNGASRFVALLSDTPEKRASEAFPRAAKANSALFFDKKEAARAKAKALSVAEVQGRVGAMIDKRVARYASVRTNLAPAQVASE